MNEEKNLIKVEDRKWQWQHFVFLTGAICEYLKNRMFFEIQRTIVGDIIVRMKFKKSNDFQLALMLTSIHWMDFLLEHQ